MILFYLHQIAPMFIINREFSGKGDLLNMWCLVSTVIFGKHHMTCILSNQLRPMIKYKG